MMAAVPLGPDTRAMAQTQLNLIGARHRAAEIRLRGRQLRSAEEEARRAGQLAERRVDLQERSLELGEKEREFRRGLALEGTMQQRAQLGVEYGLVYDPETSKWGVDPTAEPAGGIAGAKLKMAAVDQALRYMDIQRKFAAQTPAAEKRLEVYQKQEEGYRKAARQITSRVASLRDKAGMFPSEQEQDGINYLMREQARVHNLAEDTKWKAEQLRKKLAADKPVERAAISAGALPGEEPMSAEAGLMFQVYEGSLDRTPTVTLQQRVWQAGQGWEEFARVSREFDTDPDLYYASLVQELRKRGVAMPLTPAAQRALQPRLEEAERKFYGEGLTTSLDDMIREVEQRRPGRPYQRAEFSVSR